MEEQPSFLRQACSTLLLFGLACHSQALGVSPPAGPRSAVSVDKAAESAPADASLQAVYDYVRYSAPDLELFEREWVVRERLVKEIRGWPFQDKLQHHRLFSYPKGSNFQHGAYIVAVDDRQLITEFNDIEDFNDLLRREAVRIISADDAERVAQLFLKTYYAAGSLYYGCDLGVCVITSVDDIKFSNRREHDEIARSYKIEPPTLARHDTEYVYVLWSWQETGGVLARDTVILDDKRVVDHKEERLKAMVGDWVGER